jgi:hypothetical protein
MTFALENFDMYTIFGVYFCYSLGTYYCLSNEPESLRVIRHCLVCVIHNHSELLTVSSRVLICWQSCQEAQLAGRHSGLRGTASQAAQLMDAVLPVAEPDSQCHSEQTRICQFSRKAAGQAPQLIDSDQPVAESKRCWPGDTVDGLGLASGLAGQASQWMDTTRPVPVAESTCLAVDSVSKAGATSWQSPSGGPGTTVDGGWDTSG